MLHSCLHISKLISTYEIFFFSLWCEYYIVSWENWPTKAVICSKGLNFLKMQIRHILKLKTDSNTDSATEAFTTFYRKNLKLNLKQTHHSLQLKTDSTINFLTVIYSIGLKFYQKQTPSQTESVWKTSFFVQC